MDKEISKLQSSDAQLILGNLINRKRFIYSGLDIILYMVRCLCLRSVKDHKKQESKENWDKSYSHHYYFRKGVYKLQEELDVVTMLKSMRRVKLLTSTLLTQTQKMILKFQRKNLIESNSSSGDSDTNNKLDSANLL